MTKTLNQTQRKYMINQLSRAIAKKKKTASLPTPQWYDKLPKFQLNYSWGRPEPMKELKSFNSQVDFLIKHKVEIKKGAKEYCNKMAEIVNENEKLDRLEIELTSELMLGNDLNDLKEVLKKVADA